MQRAAVVERRPAGSQGTRDRATQVDRFVEHQRLGSRRLTVAQNITAVRPREKLHAPAVYRDVVERHPHRRAVAAFRRKLPVDLVLMPRHVAPRPRGLEDQQEAPVDDLPGIDAKQRGDQSAGVGEVCGLQQLRPAELGGEDLVDDAVAAALHRAFVTHLHGTLIGDDFIVESAQLLHFFGRGDRRDRQVAARVEVRQLLPTQR